MKYAFSLMALLVCALLFTGCDRSQLTAEKPDDEQEVSLELSTEQPQEDTTHSPDETLTLLRPDDETEAETTEPSSEENAEEKPSDKGETPADETEPATEQTVETPTTSAPIVGSETLPFSPELMTRPTEELTDNPQKLDIRLYAVFQNVMEQNFSRKEGKLFVYRLNGDGTEDYMAFQNLAYTLVDDMIDEQNTPTRMETDTVTTTVNCPQVADPEKFVSDKDDLNWDYSVEKGGENKLLDKNRISDSVNEWVYTIRQDIPEHTAPLYFYKSFVVDDAVDQCLEYDADDVTVTIGDKEYGRDYFTVEIPGVNEHLERAFREAGWLNGKQRSDV